MLLVLVCFTQAYKRYMSQRRGSEPEHLDGTIAFINMTSKLIYTFADIRPISSLDDHRLAMNHEILEYFQKWEMDAQSHQELSKADCARRLLSQKLRFDISSMIIGFQEVCKIAFIRFPGSTISPFRTNSDLVENVFCQETGNNGQNSNPTYAQYGPTMNSILLRQTTTTSCSNTGSVENLTFFKSGNLRSNKTANYSMLTKASLRNKNLMEYGRKYFTLLYSV